jgi:translation initiation factor 2 alpha subunit (eIF-2alpha)
MELTVIVLRVLPLSLNKASDTGQIDVSLRRTAANRQQLSAWQRAWQHNRKHVTTLQQIHQLAMRYGEGRKVTLR